MADSRVDSVESFSSIEPWASPYVMPLDGEGDVDIGCVITIS